MAEGKWIDGLTPGMALEAAARVALTQRFSVVTKALPLAIHAADEDIEHVHQLRVATRRADACLRIFRDCLSGKKYRSARARLRTVRRAAGDARDSDVFLEALHARESKAKAADLPGLDFLVGFALGQRAVAQEELECVEADQTEPFEAFVSELLDKLRPPKSELRKTLDDLARPTLTLLLDRVASATNENLDDYDHLHQVRIAGKRLRYAIEILVECFGTTMRDRVYPEIEAMQEILGRANDSHVAIVRLQKLLRQLQSWADARRRVKGGIEKLLRFHQRRLPLERKRFLAWLGKWKRMDVVPMLGESPVGKAHETNGKW